MAPRELRPRIKVSIGTLHFARSIGDPFSAAQAGSLFIARGSIAFRRPGVPAMDSGLQRIQGGGPGPNSARRVWEGFHDALRQVGSIPSQHCCLCSNPHKTSVACDLFWMAESLLELNKGHRLHSTLAWLPGWTQRQVNSSRDPISTVLRVQNVVKRVAAMAHE